jgi:hypothetical protein
MDFRAAFVLTSNAIFCGAYPSEEEITCHAGEAGTAGQPWKPCKLTPKRVVGRLPSKPILALCGTSLICLISMHGTNQSSASAPTARPPASVYDAIQTGTGK